MGSNLHVVDALNAKPLAERLALIAESLLETQHAQVGVMRLIALASALAKFLDAQAQSEVKAFMKAEVDQIDEPHALH